MLSQAIFSTLAYHSIFDYPLTLDEFHRFLLINCPISSNEVTEELDRLIKQKYVSCQNGLYQLANRHPERSRGIQRSDLNIIRLKRQVSSKRKIQIARRAAYLIGLLPWIKLICVTGSLAMENSDPGDDIDLMIVTSPNRLWIVRPLAILLVSLFFKRRKPSKFSNHSNHFDHFSYKNHICLNLWLDESALEIPQARRNLYTAHELAQMKPVVNRDGTYEKMMWENRWGRKFLANAWKNFNRQIYKYPNRQIDKWNLIDLLNRAVFYLQLKYMRSKMTNERVSLHAAFFHPGNRADTILNSYDRLCHRYF